MALRALAGQQNTRKTRSNFALLNSNAPAWWSPNMSNKPPSCIRIWSQGHKCIRTPRLFVWLRVWIKAAVKGKSWVPWESTRDIYQHISPIYELYNGCIRQYGVIFGEQLLGYPPKGTQNFPLKQWDDTIYIYVYVYFTFYFASSTKQEVCIFQFFNSCWPARNPSSYPFNLHLCSDKSVCSQFHNFTPSAWTGCNARGSPAWKKWHADKAQQFGNDSIGTCVRTTLSMFLCKSCNQISTESEREDVHIMHIFMHHGKNTKKLNRIKIDQLFFSSHGLKPLWCSTTMTSWQWDNMRQLWMSPKSSKEKSFFNSLNLLPKLHWANGWCTKRESTGEAGRKGLEAMRHLLHLEALLLSFNFRKKLDDRLGFHKRPTIDADASAA